MTLSTQLLITAIILLLFIVPYPISYFSLTFSFLKKKPSQMSNKKTNTSEKTKSISILVPSHNEGEPLIDLIKTIKASSYKGKTDLYLLMENENDTSYPYLTKFSKTHNHDLTKSTTLELKSNLTLHIILTGLAPKTEKLQYIIPTLKTDYVALLDADHRPDANWIESSLTKFSSEEIACVQTRRAPLNLDTYSSFWDSFQNHLGNEVVNTFLSRFNFSLFFTGTAAIFRLDILQRFPFEKCVTEDTLLSFRLIHNRYKIVYNSDAISYEEMAPDIATYIARRVRWSNGHNHSFFLTLQNTFKAEIALKNKLHLLLHGAYYTLPLFIALLLNTLSLFTYIQLPANHQLLLLLLTLLISLLLPPILTQRRPSLPTFISAALYLFPTLVMLTPYLLFYTNREFFYTLLSFPYSDKIRFEELCLLFIPLLPPIIGNIHFKLFPFSKMIFTPILYILFLLIDLYAGLVGLISFIFRLQSWGTIRRGKLLSSHLIPDDLRNILSVKKSGKTIRFKFLIVLILSILTLISFNEIFTINNCGEIQGRLYDPLFTNFKGNERLIVQLKKEVRDDKMELKLALDFIDNKKQEREAEVLLSIDDGSPIATKIQLPIQTASELRTTLPLDYAVHKLRLDFKTPTLLCRREIKIAGVVKEFRGKSLYINGEPFIIKGLIPSFSEEKSGESIDLQYKKFKEMGVNALRFYHPPTKRELEALEKNRLFFVAQPDRSTWNNISLNLLSDRFLLLRRYKKLNEEYEHHPNYLFGHLGNELENSHDNIKSRLEHIYNMLKESKKSTPNSLISYSSYVTYVDYPVDILGLNMLDSGSVYWNESLRSLKNSSTPYYASEWGGFVAFFESTPTPLRLERMSTQWNKLLQSEAVGGFFFQSHDNWAQPVNMSYNDPFVAEQPDDIRGIFTQSGEPKSEALLLKRLYSDMEMELLNHEYRDSVTNIKVRLKNRRSYTLKDINIVLGSGEKISLGTLNGNQEREVMFQLPAQDYPFLSLDTTYTTHQGYLNQSILHLAIPIASTTPTVVSLDFIPFITKPDFVEGFLLQGREVTIVLPPTWKSAIINGIHRTPTNQQIRLSFSYNSPWRPLKLKKTDLSSTDIRYDIDLSGIDQVEGFLIISGIASSHYNLFINGEKNQISGHPYRENLINLKTLLTESAPEHQLSLLLQRVAPIYVHSQSARDGIEQRIPEEPPIIFAPIKITIRRGDP